MKEYLKHEACQALIKYRRAFQEMKKELGPDHSFDEPREMPESLEKAAYYAEDCLADYRRKLYRFLEYASGHSNCSNHDYSIAEKAAFAAEHK